MVTGLVGGLEPHEQAVSLTVPVLRHLGAAATSNVDFVLVLSLVAALFSLARADHFLPAAADTICFLHKIHFKKSTLKTLGLGLGTPS